MTAHEASSSSSSKSKLWKYDVFLSFSGVDTRSGFTGHLYAALTDRGYQAFIDEDDLNTGEEIGNALFRVMEESRIFVVVFSKNYVDSSWCLDELVKIMECRSNLGGHVLPIFYYVDPSDVRNQKGDLAQAFQKHEEVIREEKDDKEREAKRERVRQWRNALTEAADLSGHHFQITGTGHEAKLIREIVDKIITNWLPSTEKLHVAKHQVGINSRMSKLWKYDVFLSFSGVDTRNGFAGLLHTALTDRGYRAFIDEDDLNTGEEIGNALFRVMEDSRIFVVVFSKSYADSSWCLDELVKIMECRSNLGGHVLPIFYYVDPSDVRNQKGDLAQAFQKHEEVILEEKDDKKREAKRERVRQWRNALTEAANLSGHHFQITDTG